MNRILESESAWEVSIWFGAACDFKIFKSLGKLTNFILQFSFSSHCMCSAEPLPLHLQYVVICAKKDVKKYINFLISSDEEKVKI